MHHCVETHAHNTYSKETLQCHKTHIILCLWHCSYVLGIVNGLLETPTHTQAVGSVTSFATYYQSLLAYTLALLIFRFQILILYGFNCCSGEIYQYLIIYLDFANKMLLHNSVWQNPIHKYERRVVDVFQHVFSMVCCTPANNITH